MRGVSERRGCGVQFPMMAPDSGQLRFRKSQPVISLLHRARSLMVGSVVADICTTGAPRASGPTPVCLVDDARAAQPREGLEKQRRWAEQLRRNARANFRAMESALSLRSEEDWIRVSEQSREQYESGGFLLDRMGAERFLDPKLIATLMALRQRRMVESGITTAAETMLLDLALLHYYHALRVQGWIECAMPTATRPITRPQACALDPSNPLQPRVDPCRPRRTARESPERRLRFSVTSEGGLAEEVCNALGFLETNSKA